uniref:RDD domain-containing protein n=1 Tax=Amphora coffeiformis TaxID=265554 RepID=A0A7S3PDC0_9STRA
MNKTDDLSTSTSSEEENNNNEDNNDRSDHRRHNGFLTGAVSHVVNPVIDCVDMDGVARRIDVAELSRRIDVADISRRIDIHHILQRVDWTNDVVDRIDWNDILLERIDLDRLVDRIDVERVVQRSKLHTIVAQSTNSIVSNMLDILRAQVIRFDLVVQDVFRPCRCSRQRRWSLPPKPSECSVQRRHEGGRCCCGGSCGNAELRTPKSPRRGADLAVAARGRFAGIVSRTMAYLIDFTFVFALFVLWLFILSESVQVIQDNESIDYQKSSAVGLLSYFVLFFVYESLMVAATNRTIGKAVLGLLIVNGQGKTQRCQLGLYRSLLKSVPFFVVPGCFLSLFRIDRRSVIDVTVCSTVIYAWDAEGFRAREQLLDEAEQLDDVHSDSDDSDDDEEIGMVQKDKDANT